LCDYIIRKNRLFYIKSLTNKGYDICLSLHDLKVHTFNNVDINDIDDDLVEVLLDNKVEYVWLNEIREVKNV